MDAFSRPCHGRMQTNHHLVLYAYTLKQGCNFVNMSTIQDMMQKRFQHCNITLVDIHARHQIVALIRYLERKDIRQVAKYYRFPTVLRVVEVRKISFSGMELAYEWMQAQGKLWNRNLNPHPHPHPHSSYSVPNLILISDENEPNKPIDVEEDKQEAGNLGNLGNLDSQHHVFQEAPIEEFEKKVEFQQREIDRLQHEIDNVLYTNNTLRTETDHLNHNLLQSCRTRMEDQQKIAQLEQFLNQSQTQFLNSENGQYLACQEKTFQELQLKYHTLAKQKFEEFSILRQRSRGPSASTYETDLYQALTQQQAQQHTTEFTLLELQGKLRLVELEMVFLKDQNAQLRRNELSALSDYEQLRNVIEHREQEIKQLQLQLHNNRIVAAQQLRECMDQQKQNSIGCRHNAEREAELKSQSNLLNASDFIHWVWHKYPPPLPFEQKQFGAMAGVAKEDRTLIRKALLYYHNDKYSMYDERVKTIASAVCQSLTSQLL